MALAPFLNTNAGKNDELYSLGLLRALHFPSGRTGTYIALDILINGKLVHTTGDIRRESFKTHYSVFSSFSRDKDSRQVRLRETTFIRGAPYTAVVPMNLRWISFPNGRVSVVVNGAAVASSSAARIGRARVARFRRNSAVYFPRSMSNAPARPSPERITRPFMRTFQTSAGQNQQDVVAVTASFREWSGTRTPGFGSLKKRALPDNPYSSRLTLVTENRYVWNQTQPASGGYDLRIRPYSEVYTMPDSPSVFIAESEFRALQRLISNANQGINSNMAQNIAQVSQLSALVFGTANTLVRALTQLKRKNIVGAVRTLMAGQRPGRWQGPIGSPSIWKSVASNWLQLQYGWKPLLSDIEGLFKVMGNLAGPQDFIQRASSTASAQRNYTIQYPPGGGLTGDTPGITTFMVTSTTRYKIRFRIENPLQAFFAQTGFTNPINLGWELLPFSFVVDWFVPIGSYFETFSSFGGCTFLGGSVSRLTKIRGDSCFGYHGPAVGEPTVIINHTASQVREETRYGRERLNTFPSSVVPSFNSAGLQAGNRAANAIALLTQAFK